MTSTVLKTYFKKQPPEDIFRNELEQLLPARDLVNMSNDSFENIFMTIFNKHAPLKIKYARANEGPFMIKDLSRAIMLRSKLRNKLNKNKTLQTNLDNKKQRN